MKTLYFVNCHYVSQYKYKFQYYFSSIFNNRLIEKKLVIASMVNTHFLAVTSQFQLFQ